MHGVDTKAKRYSMRTYRRHSQVLECVLLFSRLIAEFSKVAGMDSLWSGLASIPVCSRRVVFLGKTLHSDSASPYLGLWIKCFNQSVSQSINQSIDRSIDQSVNQSKYILVSEYSNLFFRFDLTGYLAAKIFLYMFVAKLSGDIAFTLVYIYSAELFPTTVR